LPDSTESLPVTGARPITWYVPPAVSLRASTAATMKRNQPALWSLIVAAAGSLAIVISGCVRAPKPQPLTPEAFISPQSGTISGAGGTASGSGGTVGAGESAAPAIAIPANGVSNK